MISDLFKAIRWGKHAGKSVNILLKTYDVVVQDEFNIQRLQNIALDFDDCGYDEHSVAVHYLSLLVGNFDPSNEDQKRLAIKYISRAKGAYNRGILKDRFPLEVLSEEAMRVFGLDETTIDAA